MEATELIYLTMHQERYEDLKQRILLTYGAKYDKEQEQEFSARMDFLTQLQEDTEAADFIPQLSFAPISGGYAWGFLAYCSYLLIPTVLHFREALQWHILRSRI